ncbi:uncharacterized protein [Chironomus tepperi]|uniref:uncharacterized protein n=1 Tax=Chironomus tepperi TaxID=113505 RepID=UPI00391F09F6
MDSDQQKNYTFKIQSLLCEIDVPVSLDEAQNLISSCNFDESIQEKQIIEIHLKINEKFDKQDIKLSLDHQLVAKISAIITLSSTIVNKSRIFWKTEAQEDFKLCKISDHSDRFLTKLCHEFLVDKLQNGEMGILKIFEDLNVLKPRHIGNKDEHNLLSIAITQNNDEVVEKLIMHKFNVDFEFKEDNNLKVSLIDLAWRTYTRAKGENVKISSNNIIFTLLSYDAKFPKNFNMKDASKKVQELVNNRIELHEYIQSRNYETLKDKIKSQNYKLSFYYDKANVSLLMHALRTDIDSDTFSLLKSLNLSIGSHETKEASDYFLIIRNNNRTNAKCLTKVHIYMLYVKSKVADYNYQNPEYSDHILEAYEKIDKNEHCSNVLKVAAACNGLKIFFDFKHSTTYYFDPLSSIQTKGIIYNTGEIHIGARDLLNDNEKNNVLGVIIHEFCHLAMLMTYFNDFDPYQIGESEDKTRFIEKVVKQCRENQEAEDMVCNVFDSYIPEHHHSEIIVLFCEMLMHYCVEDSKIDSENLKIIKNCELIFSELFEYFKEVVEPELLKVLPILKKLQDDDQKVEFFELTEPMKAKIIFKRNYNFQGERTSIYEIIENYEDILKFLSSNDIKDILIDNEILELGEVCKASTSYGFVKRSFTRFIKDQKCKEIEEIDQIIEKVKESKRFILAAKAGEGKTTIFENLAVKLKEKNKFFWISFIQLRNFRSVFDEITIGETTVLNDIFNVITNILFPCSKEKRKYLKFRFRYNVFKKLFNTGKVILLLDGIDEVCPKCNQHMMLILRILRNNTNNQLWVSTRPQHVDELTGTLDVEAFTLNPYGDNEQSQLIFQICKKFNKNYNYFYYDIYEFLKSYSDFNNPMLIIIVTKLYLNGKIDLKDRFYDYFGIYKLLIDSQFLENDSKVESEDRNPFLEFTSLHRVLALKFIFNENEIKDLQILKKFKKDKKSWTIEKVQRFGFVILDLKFFENERRSSIDFIHYSIAEFFVADYIIHNIFDESRNDKEIELIFELIKLIKLKNRRFMMNYLKNHWDVSDENIHRKLIELIVDEIQKSSKINAKYGDFNSLSFWCPFLRNDHEILKNLWQVNEQKTLFNKILFSPEIYWYHNSIFNFVTYCLGANWHKILNNSDKDLIIDDKSELGTSIIDIYDYFPRIHFFFKNFYKLLILAKANFNENERKFFLFQIAHFLAKNFNELHGNYFEKCFNEILKYNEIHDDVSIFIVFSIINGVSDLKKLNCLQEILEKNFKNDREKIREFLFDENCMSRIRNRLRNISSVKDKNEKFPQKFKIFFDLYDTFKNSNEEFQRLFKSRSGIFGLLVEMPTEFIAEFSMYVKKVFGSNNDTFFECLIDLRSVSTTEELLMFEDFLVKYFDGNEVLIRKGMRRILYEDDKYLNYSAGNLEQFINIRRKYQNSIEEFHDYFKSWDILSKLFLYMPNESYPDFKKLVDEIFGANKHVLLESIHYVKYNSSIINSKTKKFSLLEKFFYEFFSESQQDARKCLRKIIFDRIDISRILTNNLKNKNEFEFIKDMFLKYVTIEEIRNDFVTKNSLFISFDNYSLECHPKFVEFIKDVFKEDNEHLYSNELNFSFAVMNLLQNESEFKFFEKFLTDFYDNDQNKVQKIVWPLLFNQNIIEKQLFLQAATESLTPKFQFMREIYTKYNNSWEDIQNIFVNLQNLIEIFAEVNESTFQILQEFLNEVFESKKSLIFNCISYKSRDLLIKKPENLKFFELFLQKFTNNDENVVKDCMHKILFDEHEDNFNPLYIILNQDKKLYFLGGGTVVNPKNPYQLEYLITIYKKYKKSWEELQNIFISKSLSNLFFRYMSHDTYPYIEEFIREIFDSNKPRLNEIEIIHDNDVYVDYFYDKDNEKCFIEKFENFRNCVNLTS